MRQFKMQISGQTDNQNQREKMLQPMKTAFFKIFLQNSLPEQAEVGE